MANTKRVQIRKGTEQEHQSFTGALAEITYDTTKGVIRMHDGSTVGGYDVEKARYTLANGAINLMANTKYNIDTSGGAFTVTLPSIVSVGDNVKLIDSKSHWDINNLTVNTPGGEEFINAQGIVDYPLICDVSGASIELVWEGSYWRLFV